MRKALLLVALVFMSFPAGAGAKDTTVPTCMATIPGSSIPVGSPLVIPPPSTPAYVRCDLWMGVGYLDLPVGGTPSGSEVSAWIPQQGGGELIDAGIKHVRTKGCVDLWTRAGMWVKVRRCFAGWSRVYLWRTKPHAPRSAHVAVWGFE